MTAAKTGAARSRALRILCLGVAALAVGLATAGPASAEFGLSSFTATFHEPAGALVTQAGAHPDLDVSFGLNTALDEQLGVQLPDGQLKDLQVDLPPGLYGNPQAVTSCEMGRMVAAQGLCNTDAQVGIVHIQYGPEPIADFFTLPVYNMAVTDEETATFGFMVFGATVLIKVTAQPDGNYALRSTIANVSQGLPIFATDLTLWGVPADPSHDAERNAGFLPGGPSGLPKRPFLTMPARCEPATFTIRARSWQGSGWDSAASTTPPLTGCDSLEFRPKLTARPTASSAGAPSGFTVDLSIPQDESFSGMATPQLRRVAVKLPKGLSISPTAASGLGSCSDAELSLGTDAEPSCPESSKIGSVSVATPVLPQPLTGDVILGTPMPGQLFRLFLVLRGSGLLIKLPGIAQPDPETAQLTATFDDTPQLPFSELSMQLKGGSRGVLQLPSVCGTYTTRAGLTPWSGGEPVLSESSFAIDENCGKDSQFNPGLEAGATNPIAGAHSPFTLRVTRGDAEQNLSRIQATLPPGLLAKLAGVPLCADAQAASGACPAGSQVGTTTVGVGAGSNPLYVPEPGKAPTAVYLAGPYKGAPYSLVVKVPAQAGPFDLGTVVVRNALRVDPTTTQVTAESDPLPQILEGIPITYRDVRVEINKSEFTVNPTNCSQFAVTSVLTSSSGQTATPKAPFAAANCERLGFKPTLALQMKGQTKRAGNPALTATLKAPPGQANIANTAVILPKTVFIDQRHVSGPCTMVQFNANACPAKSILGTAVAYSPLLDKPLEGPVYFRSNGGARKLPDIVADLNGQIHVILVGFIDSKKVGKETSLVRTRFASVPDAPVSRFVLRLKGGKRSLIQNSANLCKARPKAEVRMTGQNGKTEDFKQKIAVKCGKGKKKGGGKRKS